MGVVEGSRCEPMMETPEVSDRMEQTAEFVREEIDGWEVTTSKKPGANSYDELIVYTEENVSVNGFSKASVINTVLKEVPSLKVATTDDGNMAVRFRFRNE